MKHSNLLNTFAHQTINVKLIVTSRLEQFFVACQIVIENSAVIHHATQRIIDDRDLDTMRQKLHDFTVQTIFNVLLGRRSDKDVSPVQVTMLEIKLTFGNRKN